MIKVTKVIAIKNTKTTLLNLMIFMLKRKMFLKKYDKQMSSKCKCFNCGKPGHFSKDCNKKPGKLKNKFNMLKINDKEQEELLIKSSNLASDNEAFESHLFSQPNITDEPYDPYTSQLFGKEEIHSMDKLTITGTDYARLSLKTQSLLRSVIANLPTDIQFRILKSKAMPRSFDL